MCDVTEFFRKLSMASGYSVIFLHERLLQAEPREASDQVGALVDRASLPKIIDTIGKALDRVGTRWLRFFDES